MGSSQYDLVIIGGGINGCAVARLAARNGFAVALVEKNDIGAGVTSRSTRLIHGGLRYLERGHLGLVRESLRDRRALLREYPGLVAPQAFLIPVYRSDSRAAIYIQAGLWMYGLLNSEPRLAERRRLSPEEIEVAEPSLDRRELTAGFVYYDCQAVYPERLALEMALEAEEAGAVIRNHALVTEILVENGRVVGARAGEEEFRGRLVVNAGGAWADQVRELVPQSNGRRLLSLLNGAHVIARPFAGAPQHAIYHEARSDKRPFFIVPWRDLYLIGTTETPFEGDPDRVAPTEAEVEYLLREARLLLPGAELDRGDLLYSYAGSRPLLRAGGGNWNSASRDHSIFDHEKEEGLAGMLTLVGGKLTTARSFAREVVRAVATKLGAAAPVDSPVKAIENLVGEARLTRIYGRRASDVKRLEESEPGAARAVADGAPTTVGQVLYALRREKARTLGDVLLRRTGLAFEAGWREEWAEAVAEVVAKELGWSDGEKTAELENWRMELRGTLIKV